MLTSTKRRLAGVLMVVLASQALSACVVVPVPHRHRAVVVHPGYGPPPPVYYDPHPRWRR
jgi:hypothetical protein